jgi:hypothetical protein
MDSGLATASRPGMTRIGRVDEAINDLRVDRQISYAILAAAARTRPLSGCKNACAEKLISPAASIRSARSRAAGKNILLYENQKK